MTELDGQLEAFPSPLRGLTVVMWYDDGYGWSVRVATRREGQAFTPGETYERLDRPEAVDVLLEATLAAIAAADQR